MLLRICLRLFVLAVVTPLGAEDLQVAFPTVTPPSFSRVVGKYGITSAAAPTEVAVESPITLIVRISGQGPEQYQPQRRNLHLFPEGLADDFHLEDVPDDDQAPAPDANERVWTFVYRLRPKHLKVRAIPELRLLYYVPRARSFQSSFAEEIPIKVMPPPQATPAKLDLKVVQAPARFYQLRSVDEVMRDYSPLPRPGFGLLVVLMVLPLLACFIWYRGWRRWQPSAVESAQRRRSRAARLALGSLAKEADDVGQVRAAAVDFLRHRLDLPAREPTPLEVERFLRRLGFAKSVAADWNAFLQTCDRLRFAARPETFATRIGPEAIRLIQEVENDPCVMH